MAEPITMQQLTDASLNTESLDDLVNGDDSTQVTTRTGETYPSIQKLIKVMFENGALPAKAFRTKTVMEASDLPEASYAYVTDSTTLEYNGLWHKNQGVWVKSKYDVMANTGIEQGASRFVPNSTDVFAFSSLNTGGFVVQSNSSAATMTNLPSKLSGTLIIRKSQGSIATIIHVTYTDNTNASWYATKGGSVWFGWSKLATDSQITAINNNISGIYDSLGSIDSTSAVDSAINKGQLQLKNGIIEDVSQNLNHALFIGSSTIYWGHTWGILQDLFATVPNQLLDGKGGEIIEQTSARMGASVLRIKFTGGSIPASGTVAIETNLPAYKQSSLKPFSGTVLGATGTVSYSTSLNSYAFTRTDTASSPTPTTVFHDFIPNFDERYLQGYLVINVGKNNFTNSTDTAQYVFDKTVEMVNHMRPVFKRILVMGNFVDNNMTVGGSEMQRVLDCNVLLKDKYGDLYIDSQSYLTSDQVWADTGITKTAADATAQSEGRLASSLGMDAMHMSEVVWQALADNVIKPKIDSFGWL